MTRWQRGDAEEWLFCRELEAHLRCVAWATGGSMAVKTARDGRKIPMRIGRDVLGLWDVVAIGPDYDVFAQVKGGARYRPPDQEWRARFAAMPHPRHVVYLWAWRDAFGAWRVERLLPGGERQRIAWPPVESGAA